MTSKKAPSEGVRLLREWLGTEEKNQNECSYIVGVTHEHVCRILAGKFNPSLKLAARFQDECEIPMDAWLKP